MEPKDLNLYVEKRGAQADAGAQSDAGAADPTAALADAAAALSTAASALSGRGAPTTSTTAQAGQVESLSFSAKRSIQQSLQQALEAELAKAGPTLGLRPGDLVAISSSVGQSISF